MGSDMPQGGGWRSEAAYDYVCELGPSEFAWEFLRRNPDYRRDYRAVVDEGVGRVERCRASARDPIYCAIAVYRGSWDRPDSAFANAVKTSVARNDAPDFEMLTQTAIDGMDVDSTLRSSFHDVATPPSPVPDDRERAWSSALFPAKSQQVGGSSTADVATGRPAVSVQKSDAPSARQPPTPPRANDLFVPTSAQRSPP